MHYLKRFTVTGSVCPSTSVFGERAALEVGQMARDFDRVIVAGVGSGVVASRILKYVPDAVFVECEDRFAARFSARHPHARVVTDMVQNLFEHLPELRQQRLLLASFIPTAGSFYSDDVVRMFVAVCRNGGSVMQMRYLPHQMSARFFDGLRARGIVSRRLFTVARNFPPVSMYGLRSLLAPVATAASLTGSALGHGAAAPRQAGAAR
jgi:phospholipid N-methyltransferase